MLWKESWQNMTFEIFAHGLQISFANTHWWQNLCAFVDILHAQNKHGTLFFLSKWEIFLILGIEILPNICADFLTLARGGFVSIFLLYYCWISRTSLMRLCCPEIGLEVFDPVCKGPSLWKLFITDPPHFLHFYNAQSFTFYCDQYTTICKLVVLLSLPMNTLRKPKNRNKLGQRNTDHKRKSKWSTEYCREAKMYCVSLN